jgi:hypothetical protein
VTEPELRRAIKIDSLSDEAKAAARELKLDDNQSAQLAASKHKTPQEQVKALKQKAAAKPKARPNALPEKPEVLGYLELWLRNGAKMVAGFGGADQAVALAREHQVLIRADQVAVIREFLGDTVRPQPLPAHAQSLARAIQRTVTVFVDQYPDMIQAEVLDALTRSPPPFGTAVYRARRRGDE